LWASGYGSPHDADGIRKTSKREVLKAQLKSTVCWIYASAAEPAALRHSIKLIGHKACPKTKGRMK